MDIAISPSFTMRVSVPLSFLKAIATLDALKQIKTPEHIAALRGKTVEEILG